MKMPDVNILIYAHKKEYSEHQFYQTWLEDLSGGPEPFALSPFVAVAFIRIVTRSPVENPTPLSQALRFIDTILSSEYCHQPHAGKNHWQLVRTLCQATKATGKLVGDIQHAALAIEHGCTWITRDADFKKFKPHGLRLEVLQP